MIDYIVFIFPGSKKRTRSSGNRFLLDSDFSFRTLNSARLNNAVVIPGGQLLAEAEVNEWSAVI